MLAGCLVLAACSSSAAPAGRRAAAPVPVTTGHGHPAPTHSAPPLPPTPEAKPTRRVKHSAAPSSSAAPSTSAPPSTSASSVPPVSGRPTVVLNPGHNGGNASHVADINRLVPSGYGQEKACDTAGTVTDAGYPEHAFNWSVSNTVAAILRAHGVRVVLTRPSDDGVGPCVDRRAAIGNRPDVAAVVSIHADGAYAAAHGFHVNQDSRTPDGATRRVARQSYRLGRVLHDALAGSSGLVPANYVGTDGYFYRADLAGLNLATRPATFLELGNMKNPGDSALQSSASGRRRIARAVAAGILTYLARS